MTNSPELRRRLVVVSRDDYNLARSAAPDLLSDPFTTVVPVPLRPPWTDVPQLRAVEESLEPGALLVRNRWDGGAYVTSVEAYERFSVAKFNLVAAVCQRLGAHRLEVQEARELSDEGRVTARVEFQAGAARGDGSVGHEQLHRVAQSIQGTWTWRDGVVDAAAARRLADECGLGTDPVVSGLIRQRSTDVNLLREQIMELDVTSEAQREIQFALKVESLLRKLGPSFGGTFARTQAHSQHLRLRVHVSFDP